MAVSGRRSDSSLELALWCDFRIAPRGELLCAMDHRPDHPCERWTRLELQRAGAAVTHHGLPAGHEITAGDRVIAHDWLQSMHRDRTQLEQ